VSAGQIGQRINEHYDKAITGGLALTPFDLENMGRAFEWQGRFSAALEKYEAALARSAGPRPDLRKHVLVLRLQIGTPAKDMDRHLDSFLAGLADHRLDLRLWAIEQKLYVLEDLGRLNQASTLLVRNAGHFRESDLHDAFSFLEALLLYKSGSHDETETYLRAIRNRMEPGGEVDARTGWLLGRVVLGDGGPQRPLEALSFFEDVVNGPTGGPYAIAARLGMAESLAMLERHDEAVSAYRVAIEDLNAIGGTRLISTGVLRVSVGLMAQRQREAGNLRAALDYARLAMELTDPGNGEQVTAFLEQRGQIEQLFAEDLHRRAVEAGEAGEAGAGALGEEAHEMFADAGITFMELARLTTLNERRSAEAAWRAAELAARANQPDRAIRLYRAFTTERPLNPLVPRALTRVGELLQAQGRLTEAIETYQDCYRRYPRTLDGSRALIPLARCYLASGPDNDELAEKTLRLILDDSDVFTPRAPEFADALFLLGGMLNRRGEYERAIATLEEALERYPDDPRVVRARILLADSYRHSALALKKEIAQAASATEIERMRIESTERFEKAQELYRQLIAEYELRDATKLSRLEAMYLRHAYLYEADCFFEVGDYRRALKLYEEAAGNYKALPTGLAAYVQMINCHVFLGKPEEARAALARARILVEAIPEEAFDRSLSPETRPDWKRYFEWLGESELF
jgi:tetratricopeptide (TPR) repeat protein